MRHWLSMFPVYSIFLIAFHLVCTSPATRGLHQPNVPLSGSETNTNARENEATAQLTSEFFGKKEFIRHAQHPYSEYAVSKSISGDALMPGDLIEITLMEKLPLSQEKRVEIKRIDENGEVFIYPAGMLKLMGLNLTEARNLIEKILQNYIISPLCELSVIKREYEPQVFVFGEVMKPGAISFKEGKRLLDMLSASGGTTQNAGISGIKVVRVYQDSVGIFTINLNELLKRGRIENNLLIKDQDIIYVPRSILSSASDIFVKLGSILPWYYFIHNF